MAAGEAIFPPPAAPHRWAFADRGRVAGFTGAKAAAVALAALAVLGATGARRARLPAAAAVAAVANDLDERHEVGR